MRSAQPTHWKWGGGPLRSLGDGAHGVDLAGLARAADQVHSHAGAACRAANSARCDSCPAQVRGSPASIPV